MYEAFYGLREKPFSILPDPDLIYWGHNHLLAFAMLEFGVTNSAGFTVITGEVGSGKTTLLRFLLRRLDIEYPEGYRGAPSMGHDVLEPTVRGFLSGIIPEISSFSPQPI